MIKTTYEVTVTYFDNTEPATVSLTDEAAEAVAAQAKYERDLRFVQDGTEIIIPWSAVISVTITPTIEKDDTPVHDDICDGVRKKDGITIVTLGEGSLITMDTDAETGEPYVTQHYVYNGQEYDVAREMLCEAEFPAELVESVIFNGEEVPKDGLTFHICKGGECDCPTDPDDMTHPERYFFVSAEIDGDTVCGCFLVPIDF